MTQDTLARDVLTRDEARRRATQVSNVEYVLDITLAAKAPTYRGSVVITFDSNGDPTFLDFRGKTIERFRVSGVEVAPRRDGHRIVLPADQLRSGANRIEIEYENEFDHQGDGFHQFIDPEDDQEYIYSNFEPFEAHRLFPCFDQPDLKASYTLTVTAPTAYTVISNAAAEANADAGSGLTRHRFKKIGPFSTYLFALVVGNYHRASTMHGDIEVGFYCRTSMAKHLDTDELFEVTGQGLDFFGDFFGVSYPWGKYDQLFVPEFNAGAMENVGCVTHNEFMVFRDPPTRAQRRERAEVILHEMAHMWFGDLVTMRWWDDLWLNESFATYMAYLCLDEATKFTTAWQDFNAGMKNWAYRQDQLITTHPISADIADTDQTFLNFDGITYAKGASVLRQLAAAIGPEGFREGMRRYFRDYAYGNTDLRQFLGSLEQGSGKDLGEWARLWLETASLNTLSATWEADGDRLTSLKVLQTAPAHYPTIRPHRLDLGLLRLDDGHVVTDVIPASVDAAEHEVPVPAATPTPGLVLPNINDLAYAKVALDRESVEFARANMERIDDALTRQLLWSSFWQMVRDQQLKSLDYLAFVREKLPLETDSELVSAVLGLAVSALDRYVPDSLREAEGHALFQTTFDALQKTSSPDDTITWARAAIGSAMTAEDVTTLGKLVDGQIAVPQLELDQDMRWTIAIKHVIHGLAGAQERVKAEAELDPTDRGQRAQLQAEVSVPDPAVKEAAWARFSGEGYGSLYLTRAAMSGFHWWKQREMLAPYTDRFFAAIEGVFRDRDKEFASTFFRALYPSYRVNQDLLARTRDLLARNEGKNAILERAAKEAIDELERAIACREFALGQR
jgi:aminopeptidase N